MKWHTNTFSSKELQGLTYTTTFKRVSTTILIQYLFTNRERMTHTSTDTVHQCHCHHNINKLYCATKNQQRSSEAIANRKRDMPDFSWHFMFRNIKFYRLAVSKNLSLFVNNARSRIIVSGTATSASSVQYDF